MPNALVISLTLVILLMAATIPARAQRAPDPGPKNAVALRAGQTPDDTPANVLSREQWRRVDAATARALDWLASRQQADGSFASVDLGQPGVTSLCVLAFMAHGHGPGDGVYGTRIRRAVDFIQRCQKENGLISLVAPDGPIISRDVEQQVGNCAVYNHGISALALSEHFGAARSDNLARTESVIRKALSATLEMQRWPKARPNDKGGWRYLQTNGDMDGDISVTGWQLKFLRSARNAGFDVPEQPIKDAVAYIRRCYDVRFDTFVYAVDYSDSRSRGAAGAGILALAHAGFHHAPEALHSGDWMLAQGFRKYNVRSDFNGRSVRDRYHYGLFMCCQGAYQLGGKYWKAFFPPVVETVIANQSPDGSWPPESHRFDARFGSAYTTALVLLTLGAPNQLLPIYQR